MPNPYISSRDQGARSYTEVTDPGYAECAAATFTLDMSQPGYPVLRGACPRCKDFMLYPVLDDVYKTIRSNRSSGTSNAPGKAVDGGRVEPMICTCENEHPERPAGAEGCGAYWSLHLTFEPQ